MRLLQEANRRTHEKSSSETALLLRGRPNQKGKGKPKGRGAQATDKCHRCQQPGHWARNCKEAAPEKKQGGESVNLAVKSARDLGTQEVGRVYAMRDGSSKTNSMLLDCAAMSHMFYDADNFSRYTASPPGDTISIGDGK
jgi:hypothetical protein